jgi:hypothetical protein
MNRIPVFAPILVLFSVLTVTIAMFRASAPKAYPLTEPIQHARPYREAQASADPVRAYPGNAIEQ